MSDKVIEMICLATVLITVMITGAVVCLKSGSQMPRKQ